MSTLTVRCPLPRCGAENAFEAESCAGCGTPVRGYARLSAHASYLFNQGLAAARERRFTAAREHFAAVVHWCPADTEARNALALAAFELGDTDEARRQWERVRDRRPDDPLAGRGLSRIAEDPG
jgi:TolA-binding protein